MPPEPSLHLFHSATKRTFRIRDGLVLGRSQGQALFEDDPKLSGAHCKFALQAAGMVTIEDLDSTNGTWLNDRRLDPRKPRSLRAGDVLKIGDQQFSITTEAPAEAPPAPEIPRPSRSRNRWLIVAAVVLAGAGCALIALSRR